MKIAFERIHAGAVLVCTAFYLITVNSPCSAGPEEEAISLNNEGVTALKANDFQLAKEKFEAALRLQPNYELARVNLAMAYNNYALPLVQSDAATALAVMQTASALDPSNASIKGNIAFLLSKGVKPPATLQEYAGRAQSRIKSYWVPPKEAQAKGRKAVVSFSLTAAGLPVDIRIKTSAGSEKADQSVLKAVEQSAPFGAFPPNSPPSIALEMTFDFSAK